MANTFIWTVIPVAVKNGRHPIVAVYLSPRLGPPPSGAAAPTLDMYPDFKDWPTTVKDNISFTLNIYALESDQLLASMETQILSQPDLKVWQSLFPPGTPVTANPDPTKDGRLNRTYESYSVRRSAEYVRNGYLAVAATSAQQAQTSPVSARRFRALLPAVPPPAPTAEEVAGHFASSNLFLPQSPTEPEKEDQRKTLKAFTDWVRPEEDLTGVRHQIQRSVAGYLGRLAPGTKADQDVMALFKADVIRRVVDRAATQANQTGPTWPNPPAEANRSARFAALASVANLADTMSLDDHLNRAQFHRQMVGTSNSAQCEPHDFHQLLSMLGSHPLLYSHAGVVFDLLGQAELPAPDRARVSVEVTFKRKQLVQTPLQYFPRTAYQIFEKQVASGKDSADKSGGESADKSAGKNEIQRKKTFFLPCSRKNGSAQAQAKQQSQEDAISMGVLDLSDLNRFHLETMDTHGDYFKTAKLDPTGTPESPIQPENGAALPKLRSCGMALVRSDRTQKIKAAATTNAGHFDDIAKPNSTTFYAEDLAVGYRVDVCVLPDPAKDRKLWKSLCLRNTTWDLPGTDGKSWRFTPRVGGEFEAEDPKKANEYDQLESRRLEGIVHSGSTQAIDANSNQHQVMETMFRWENWSLSVPVPVKNRPEPPIDPCATGLLRVRAHQKMVNHSLPPLRYGWGYYIRCRAAFLDGSGLSLEDCNDSDSKIGDNGAPFTYYRLESIDSPLLLLASPLEPKKSPGEQMNHLVLRQGNATPYRVVVPPRVSPYLAYLHGNFDSAQRGAFADYIWNPDGTFATVAQLNGKKEPDSRDQDNAIFVKREKQQLELAHPYFPDPASDCARINLIHRRIDKSGPQTDTVEFYTGSNGWPDAQPFALALDGPAPGQKGDATLSRSGTHSGLETLSIGLQKGRTAKLVLSSCLLPTKTRKSLGPLFRFFHGLHSHVNPFLTKSGHNTIQPDTHWLLTSQTEVQLVHAVEKPLLAPSFKQLFLKKDEIQGAAGNSSVMLHSQLLLDADSTGKVDISARWTDDVDDATTPENNQESTEQQAKKPGITEHSTEMHVHSMPVQLQEFEQPGENTPELVFSHNLGDMKHHLVTYSVSGSSRFSSYYTSKKSDSSERFTARHHDHDRTVCIPNRARPDKPKILYLIPSFRWDDDEIKHGRIHHRWGGGIRVYIDRGWLSSGNGELLGVLLAEGTVPEAARDLCTQMGSDPLWQGPSVPATPGVKDFQGFEGFVRCFRPDQDCTQNCEETSLSGLTIQERDDFKVTAIGYTPQFDKERQLRYCDIVLSPKKAYYPFVRFALAWFQPNSIDGAHLSNVVTADFIQLAPDRWVVLQKEKHHLSVTVYGYAYSASSASAAGSKMVFTVEERISAMNDEFCWIPATDPHTKRLLTQTAQADPASKLGKSKSKDRESKNLDIPADVYAWHQEFDLPHRGFAVHRRLLIQEVETFETDDRAQGKTINDKTLCDRVVFADIVQI